MSFIVGLTGGIGSGKSAADDEFERLGASVVDTDVIARELTGPGGAALPGLVRLFGAGLLDASGAMDRAKMRDLAFADPAVRKALEALLHPMIRESASRAIAAARGPYVVLVVPLLIESSDYRERVDRVLVVDAPEPLQIERVRARSGWSEAQVRAVLAAQASRAARLAAADDVIDNRGTMDALRQQVAALHGKYLQYSQSAP